MDPVPDSVAQDKPIIIVLENFESFKPEVVTTEVQHVLIVSTGHRDAAVGVEPPPRDCTRYPCVRNSLNNQCCSPVCTSATASFNIAIELYLDTPLLS